MARNRKRGRPAHYCTASPDTLVGETPLLLIHSINAAGSAYEIKLLYGHYRTTRSADALELPGRNDDRVVYEALKGELYFTKDDENINSQSVQTPALCECATPAQL